MWDLDLPFNTWCFRPIRVHKPNGNSIGLVVFAQMHRGVPILYNGLSVYPVKIAPSHLGIWTSRNTWFIGPTRVRNANGNLIVSAVFAGLTSVTDRQSDRQTDRQTDRPRYWVRCGVIMRNYVGYGKGIKSFHVVRTISPVLSRYLHYVQNI